jgi:hypothetical protein
VEAPITTHGGDGDGREGGYEIGTVRASLVVLLGGTRKVVGYFGFHVVIPGSIASIQIKIRRMVGDR